MRRDSIYSESVELAGKRVAVIGLARSGLACARFLLGQGAKVIGADSKPRSELTEQFLQITGLGGEVVAEFAGLEQLGDVDLIVVSPGVPYNLEALQQARQRGIAVIGELELAYWFCRAPILAVTGTNGKGSTVMMTGKILEAAGIAHLIAGNIGLPLISQVDRTTTVDVVVTEVSSFQLETIQHFRPWQACLLNISPDHLDRHASLEEYVAAKRRIFENQGPEDVAIICIDDPVAAQQATAVKSRLRTVSTNDTSADGHLEDDDLVVLVDGRAQIAATRADIRAPGLHQVRNALCAALMAIDCGAPVASIAHGLRNLRPADHLLQTVCEIDGVTYVDDSKATNPAAAVADLRTLSPPLIAIAGGVAKNVDAAEFASALGRRCRLVLLIGENRKQLQAAIGDRTQTELCDSLEEAVQCAHAAACPGDTVVLIPGAASFDMFTDQVERGERFAQLCRALR